VLGPYVSRAGVGRGEWGGWLSVVASGLLAPESSRDEWWMHR
jgi:hypothetical protein